MLAPAAAGLGGNVTVGMKYKSLLGSNMMPVISTITGGGEMQFRIGADTRVKNI